MKRATLILLLVAALALPSAANAQDEKNICLCTNTLVRMFCKTADEIGYVGKVQESTYLLSFRYGAKVTAFYCMVSNGYVRLNGKAGVTVRQSIPYTEDPDSACGYTNYTEPECPRQPRVLCCTEKTPTEQKEEELNEFWSRPIPEILQEELNRPDTPENTEEDTAIVPVPAPSEQ